MLARRLRAGGSLPREYPPHNTRPQRGSRMLHRAGFHQPSIRAIREIRGSKYDLSHSRSIKQAFFLSPLSFPLPAGAMLHQAGFHLARPSVSSVYSVVEMLHRAGISNQ